MSGTTYISSDDSALLRKALRGRSGERALEIGAGNGGGLCELSRGFGLVVGTDLIRPSMSDWKGAGACYVLAEGASCLRDSAFDLVAFNPPYLASGGTEDAAVAGGEGLEVPKEFLREALRTVRNTGTVVFLLNDEADEEEFSGICAEKGFRLRRIGSERAFFEELRVYSASASDQRSGRKVRPIQETP